MLMTSLFFLLDQKETKNQENSIGLREDYSSSANFLPPRAGKATSIRKRLVY